MSPQILENAFNRVDFDRELVFKFFITFSLFEYALKEVGFRQPVKNDDAQPDWDSFARAISGEFDAQVSPELSTAVEYFFRHPTQKQVVREDHLTFIQTRRPNKISDTEWLSILIRRVRNNLFHGGKFRYDRHRDTLLIQFSIVILESWAECRPDVNMVLQNIQ